MQMRYGKARNSPRGWVGVAALGGFIVLVFLATFVLTFKRWEGQAPRLSFDREFSSMGRSPALSLKVEDLETGLRHVTILLKQKDQEIVLADESFDRTGSQKSRTYDIGKLIAEKYMIQAGPASLTVKADDYAFRHFLKGNRTDVIFGDVGSIFRHGRRLRVSSLPEGKSNRRHQRFRVPYSASAAGGGLGATLHQSRRLGMCRLSCLG